MPQDPAYDLNRLRQPMATSFPVPCCVERVQHMASELLARLPTLAGRGQKEATIVLNMTADWPGLDDEGRNIVYQRLYLYALVASYGWPDCHRRHQRCRRRRRPSAPGYDNHHGCTPGKEPAGTPRCSTAATTDAAATTAATALAKTAAWKRRPTQKRLVLLSKLSQPIC